ncbi:hypothetical protein D3C80_1041990 [compost metagenome]
MFHPWASGVHQAFGTPGKGFAAVDVDRFYHPQAILTPCAGDLGAGTHFATAFFHFLGVQHHQASIVDPAVGIFETALQFRFQHRFWSKAQTLAAWQAGAFAQVIVQEQTDTDHPGRTQVRLVRQTETHWEGNVRCQFQQHFTLCQRFADQTEFVVFQVAQATVDQFGTGGRRSTGQVLRFQQQYGQAAPGSIRRDAGTVDAATDNDQVFGFHVNFLQMFEIALSCSFSLMIVIKNQQTSQDLTKQKHLGVIEVTVW